MSNSWSQIRQYKMKLYEEHGKRLPGQVGVPLQQKQLQRPYQPNWKQAVAALKEKRTDVMENRSERNRWIENFRRFSDLEELDRKAVIQLVKVITVLGKDELQIQFNYQDEYEKALAPDYARYRKGWWSEMARKSRKHITAQAAMPCFSVYQHGAVYPAVCGG